jgi:hypothetical protein
MSQSRAQSSSGEFVVVGVSAADEVANGPFFV